MVVDTTKLLQLKQYEIQYRLIFDTGNDIIQLTEKTG